MERDNIPDDVSRFILLAVPSIPYLEAMLLMCQERAVPWNSRQLAARIYVNEKAAQSILTGLHDQGILTLVDQGQQLYQFCPDSPELNDMIERVAEIYAKNLIGVTNLIHSSTNKKARQFAEAFIWRKDF